VNSRVIGVREMKDLLDICGYLYEERTEMKIVLKYPHYWKVDRIENGVMHLKWTDKVRTERIERWIPPATSGVGLKRKSVDHDAEIRPPPPPPRRITLKTKKLTAPAAQPVRVPSPDSIAVAERPVTKLKLNFKGAQLGQPNPQ